MEKTTFRDPEVRARLDRYVKVKFQAEDPERPEIQSVLDRYGVVGLPTYVVLDPTPAGGGATP
jgi:thiol:disulfide interchange protein